MRLINWTVGAITMAFITSACGDAKQQENSSSLAGIESSSPPANYPYDTWQGDEPNCVPRAFQTHTDTYDSDLLYGPKDALGNPVTWIDSGNKTFYNRGEGAMPMKGDVTYYDYYSNDVGYDGHAGVCVGTTEGGRAIIATGHEDNPYQAREYSELDAVYTPAYPVP